MQPSAERALVTLPLPTVGALAVSASNGTTSRVDALRAAGHAGGSALAEAFEDRVRRTDQEAAHELTLGEFNTRVAEFFARVGWGRMTMSSLYDVVAAIDLEEAWEPRATGPAGGPSCHVSTGVLSAFFGAFAPYAVAALEVECSAAGQPRCRFLLGPPAVLEQVYERVAAGADYETALSQLSGASTAA